MHQWKFSINNQKPLVMEHDYYEISNKFLDKDWYLWIWILWLPSNYNLTMLTLVAWHGVAVTPHSAWASHVSPLSGIHFRLLSPVNCQAQDRAARSRVTETWVGKFVDCSRLEAPAHRVDTGIKHFNVINFVFIFELDTIDNCWRADHWAVISNDQAPSPGLPMVTCVVTGR